MYFIGHHLSCTNLHRYFHWTYVYTNTIHTLENKTFIDNIRIQCYVLLRDVRRIFRLYFRNEFGHWNERMKICSLYEHWLEMKNPTECIFDIFHWIYSIADIPTKSARSSRSFIYRITNHVSYNIDSLHLPQAYHQCSSKHAVFTMMHRHEIERWLIRFYHAESKSKAISCMFEF
jgi:hypothetical protein